ncbi:adenosine receptor A2b-like [Latimeria chalumnae]|uniref:adenosine receptor A2b-like n=1 Tax=Latimeria chalumnae TaxID=7897 RepID=UPI0003C12493|nr:PREDICTED: adenosine receptor A2b-like [Latimeria chalumnae]|eukprot:XP_006009090.1 PREDICTED: adenosine receptor A2b-like [Latimeria chalumnae]
MELDQSVSCIYIAVEALIAIMAIAGNTLVCWAVASNRRLRTATNYFIVSLAMSDIAVGVLVIPFAITISVELTMDFHGCLFLACLVLALTQSSIFSLLAITVYRYLAISFPLRYPALVTGRRAKYTITILWILALVIGLIPLFGWNQWHSLQKSCSGNTTHRNHVSHDTNCSEEQALPLTNTGLAAQVVEGGSQTNNSVPCGASQVLRADASTSCHVVVCKFDGVVDMSYMVYVNSFVCVLFPMLLLLGIYTKIFMVARRQLMRFDPTKGNGGCRAKNVLLKEIHAAKSFSIIVGLFALCWMPLHILNCIFFLCTNCAKPLWALDLAIVLSHANSAVNPVIYAYHLPEFQKTFRKIVCCRQGQAGRGSFSKASISITSTRTEHLAFQTSEV